MKHLEQIRQATLKLRAESGRPGFSTRVKAGKMQLVMVSYAFGGKSVVTPASGWMPVSEMAGFINQFPI